MGMTKADAARILDPETAQEAARQQLSGEPDDIAALHAHVSRFMEACRMGAYALRYLDGLDTPLTPGELWAWDNQPAWLVPLGEQLWEAQWSIMRHGSFYARSSEMGIEVTTQLRRDRYGETWLAYRSPPAADGADKEGV